MARALYRTTQVLHALRPKLGAEDIALARSRLSERELRLFFTMEKRDQRHAVAVARRLIADGEDDSDLITAALLHDCGKGAVPIWLRVAYVLAPGLVRRLVRNGSAAYRLVNHERLGKEKAQAAGASPVAMRLIEERPGRGEQELLERLIKADDAS